MVVVLGVDVAKSGGGSAEAIHAHTEKAGTAAAGSAGRQVQAAKAPHETLMHEHRFSLKKSVNIVWGLYLYLAGIRRLYEDVI